MPVSCKCEPGVVRDGSNSRVLVTHVGDSDWVSISWFQQTGQAQPMRACSISACLSNKKVPPKVPTEHLSFQGAFPWGLLLIILPLLKRWGRTKQAAAGGILLLSGEQWNTPHWTSWHYQPASGLTPSLWHYTKEYIWEGSRHWVDTRAGVKSCLETAITKVKERYL